MLCLDFLIPKRNYLRKLLLSLAELPESYDVFFPAAQFLSVWAQMETLCPNGKELCDGGKKNHPKVIQPPTVTTVRSH